MASEAPRDLVVGWDVGGAHLKAARVERGFVVDVVQLPCALWMGLDRLDAGIDVLGQRWPDLRNARHAATMTGEMVDLFASRREGVVAIAKRLQARLGDELRLFDDGGWHPAEEAAGHWRGIASANWLATARWLATKLDDALLIDVGSTTTDLVPIVAGHVRTIGRDDASRLASGELVYQGVVRTPLCALGPRIVFDGVERNVMNEFFATTADVYRSTGELDPAHDQHPAADNGAKDPAATTRRLARMVGLDAEDGEADDWRAFAREWRRRQVDEIARNARVVLAATGAKPQQVVGAGCGHFVARALADAFGCDHRAVDGWMPFAPAADRAVSDWARVAAPCIAVALLAGAPRAAR